MSIINFGFTKINVEKKTRTPAKINIKSGMNITKVTESKMIGSSDQKAFAILFTFTTSYEPSIGTIDLAGELIYLADKELSEQISTGWKKNKSLPKDVALVVFSRLLNACNIETLLLSKEVGLPPPFQLPKLQTAPARKSAPKPAKAKPAKPVAKKLGK